VGKTISGVLVKESDRLPRLQLFLIFEDDTYFEIYSQTGDMSGASRLSFGGGADARRYLSSTHTIVLEEPQPEP